MSVLLLRLAGPLQSWGDASRFTRRGTSHHPTKSGVLGMVAAAQGRRRTDPVEDLAAMRFGVRTDQPGRLLRDFQTARSLDGSRTMPLSYRFYLADSVFVAGVEADRALVEGLAAALRAPCFPLFLGRRSCPPSQAVSMGVAEGGLQDVLERTEWQASRWWRAQQARRVELPIVRDAAPTGVGEASLASETVRDQPISFSPERREYGWRTVVHAAPAVVDNPDGRALPDGEPDFMAALGGG